MTIVGNENADETVGQLTLREAAERASRSVTTLRRYIRSGRLHAEKRYGRFGPEYFVSVENLIAAGLAPAQSSARGPLAPRPRAIERTPVPPPTRIAADVVPTMLYQELQLKHEQLLVQYGMVRAGGLRAIELRAETDEQRQRLQTLEKELAEIRDRSREKQRELHRELHQSRSCRSTRESANPRDVDEKRGHQRIDRTEVPRRRRAVAEGSSDDCGSTLAGGASRHEARDRRRTGSLTTHLEQSPHAEQVDPIHGRGP